MQKPDSGPPDSASEQKPPPRDPVVEQHERGAENGNPPEKPPHKGFSYRMSRRARRVKAAWRVTEFHDRLGLFIEGTGLIVLIIYTTFTALMYCSNKIAADAAKNAADTAKDALIQSIDAFRIDERAWIEIEPIKPKLLVNDPQDGALFTCDIFPKNVGKTVAADVDVKAWDFMGPDGSGNRHDWVAGVQSMFAQDKYAGPDYGDPLLTPRPMPKVIAPNTTSAAPFRLTCGAPWKGFTHYLIGRIHYCDQFRVKHTLRFCYFVVNARGEIWNCQEGNDEDHNPETKPDPNCIDG